MIKLDQTRISYIKVEQIELNEMKEYKMKLSLTNLI